MSMTFTPLTITTGLLLNLSDNAYPTRVYGWNNGRLDLNDFDDCAYASTHYGIVIEGHITLTCANGKYGLSEGMFFVCPGGCMIEAESDRGAGMVISRLNYSGLWQIGGPVERVGRLIYIDGCTDTLLAPPPRMGDPCLNHLHIPAGTNQTAHTHPSERIGVILRGSGECRSPDGVYPLQPGMGWHIPTGCLHSFYTHEESLDVIAWHPDSDFGPTDENHPMKNRTLIAKEA